MRAARSTLKGRALAGCKLLLVAGGAHGSFGRWLAPPMWNGQEPVAAAAAAVSAPIIGSIVLGCEAAGPAPAPVSSV